MLSQYIIQGILAATGIISLWAAIGNWEWFFTAKNSQFIVQKLGRKQARWYYGLLGITLIAAALLLFTATFH